MCNAVIIRILSMAVAAIALVLLPTCSQRFNVATANDTVHGSWTRVTDYADFSPRDTARGAVFLDRMWLSNGYPDDIRDLWYSKDGLSWAKVLDKTPYEVYSSLVTYKGKLWAIRCSVWSSSNGVDWFRVLDNTPFGTNGWGQVVVYRDRMWRLGVGAEVWSSIDGVKWTCVTSHAPFGDRAGSAVVVFDGKLWLMGGSTPAPGRGRAGIDNLGYPDLRMNNDVWCSTDGRNWTQVTSNAPWRARMWLSATSYARRIWIIAGYDNDRHANLADAWYTTDGAHWQEFKSASQWSPRHESTVFVFDKSLWIVAGNSWPFMNDVWKLVETSPR
jgi:hypothetical protein